MLGESVIGSVASYMFGRMIKVVTDHPLLAPTPERTDVEACHPQAHIITYNRLKSQFPSYSTLNLKKLFYKITSSL